MGPRRRLLIGLPAAALGWVALLTTAAAQRSQPAGAPAAAGELPADVAAALQAVEDFAFNFDQPGFYRVLEYLKRSSLPPGHARPPLEVDDWRVLLERPGDFRGEPITIEGIVGVNRAWQPLRAELRHLGTVWQLELRRAGQPIACTVVLTQDAGDIPLNATIRVTGYFIMIRRYYDETNRVRQAGLLVAQGPTLVARELERTPRSAQLGWTSLVVALTAGLLIAWLLLRRATARGPRDLHTLHAEHAAPLDLAEDLAAWTAEEDTQPDDQPASPSDTSVS